MTSDRYVNCRCWTLAGALALATTLASATPPELSGLEAQTSKNISVVAVAEKTTKRAAPTVVDSYRPNEAGVRKAAALGPESLRRYIQRTRMIYNYSFWDFAAEE